MEIIARVLLIGVGATVVMDLWLLLLKQLHIPTMNFAYLGRWVGHIFRGKVAHAEIGKAALIKNEVLLGWMAHYAIGIAIAGLLIFICGVEWARAPTLMPPLAVGMATVVAPLFVLQPAMGSGFASMKTPTPLFNCVKSMANHTVFGFGLYLGAFVAAAAIATSA